MFYIDPLYFLLIAPALLLSIIAQVWVKSAFSKYGEVPNRRGISGAEAARRILERAGLRDVRIEQASGFLSDHYDPRHKVLRLSEEVYSRTTLSAVGVAAHEAGHALQDAHGYAPMKVRSALVPAAQIGSNLAWPLLLFGFILQATSLIQVGVVLFAGAVLFQIVTLPVEFNASRRAMAALAGGGVLSGDELGGARRVLSAAALTYVAAAVTAVMQLIYFMIRAGLLGGRDE